MIKLGPTKKQISAVVIQVLRQLVKQISDAVAPVAAPIYSPALPQQLRTVVLQTPLRIREKGCMSVTWVTVVQQSRLVPNAVDQSRLYQTMPVYAK